jgi:hypothetical protein
MIIFDKDFKYGEGSNGWVYVRTNAESFYAVLCNSVQYHVFLTLFKEGEGYEITVLCLSVRLCPSSYSWTSYWIFIKFGREVIPLTVITKPYTLIP